ncbi:hypothetical protein PSACC_01379 [Paramicrosporidium saccamoebae]|uniref:Uncharacterized protein n=1 Tax=Paramicrosporidium saccamoebae TaxID=1246581 RepID=A0A2H9TM60_9FUNG|nr:hypothetical protein PSACC_01379 [Paramicrosporidium saccamoebae]
MPGCMERIEVIRDSRRLLVDRLGTALELHEDDSLVFPARRTFLLEWLLDSFYRLLKSGSNKISDVMQNEQFWRLMHLLLTDSQPGKRRRVEFGRPFIPILTAYLEFGRGACAEDVQKCLQWMEEHEEVLGTTTKSMDELLRAAIKTHPTAVRTFPTIGRMVSAWMGRQNNRRKVYGELADQMLQFAPLIPDETVIRRVIRDFFLCEEAFLDHHAPIVASDLPLGLYFELYIEAARSRLTTGDFRMTTMTLFKTIYNVAKTPPARLISILADSRISALQNDLAWDVCAKTLDDILLCCDDLAVFESVLRVDMGLMTPHLHRFFVLFKTGWELLFRNVVKNMADARQLDRFIVESLETDIPLELIKSLRPLIVTLHSRVSQEIIASLVQKPTITAMRWLNLFATINVEQVALHIRILLSTPPSEDLFRVLQLIVDTADLDAELYQEISAFSVDCPAVQTALALKGHGPIPTRMDDPEISYRYLPKLLCHGTQLSLKSPPEWILTSAVFWETVPNVDQLLLENLDNLPIILKHLPITPSAEVCLTCLNVLDRSNSLHEPHLAKLLHGAFPVDMMERLFRCGASPIKLLLFERGSVSVEFVQEFAAASLHQMISVVNILEKLSPSQLQPIVEAFLSLDAMSVMDVASAENTLDTVAVMDAMNTTDTASPLDTSNLPQPTSSNPTNATRPEFYRLGCCISRHLDRDCTMQIGLSESQRWRMRIAFYESGLGHLADVNLQKASDEYLQGNLLSGTDLARFIRGSNPDDISAVLATLETQGFSDRMISLLDAFLIQSVECQLLACPVVDRFILTHSNQSGAWIKLLHHRTVCGGANLGTFSQILDVVLAILVRSDDPGVISLLSVLMQNHWNALLRRRPVLLSLLVRWMSQPRTARLLLDFATHRQADQHYYVAPLLLAHCSLSANLRLLQLPAMCMLLRHLDTPPSTEKYFDSNPMERLMRFATTDDSKVILRNLIKTYRDEYKYTGKA